jgi:hypothetical protein
MTDILAFAAQDIAKSKKKGFRAAPQRTRCVLHSVPKRKLSRRVLAIPNPRNYAILCVETEACWTQLESICKKSPVSLTVPKPSSVRALEGENRRTEGIERALRSVGSRYVLRADFARFYPSIYTHSIGWAIHGKTRSRANKTNSLFGNRLDLWTRELQDKQTGGVPIGPDTSYLIAEVIASQIDTMLGKNLGGLKGTRYIDDYHLYFPSLSRAEEAHSALHRIARQFEIDINDLKTDIAELPEPIEPFWKTQLRQIDIKSDDFATSLKAIFDRAAELARQYPQDSLFTYLARKIEKTTINPTDWDLCEALLLRGAVGEPGSLPVLMRIYDINKASPSHRLSEALESLCLHHSNLQQASEVAWALWFAKQHQIKLSQVVANAVSQVDDDVVALVTLDLHYSGLIPVPRNKFSLWSKYMKRESLNLEHWLLAYEALEQGWLTSLDGSDYVAADSFFSLLQKHKIKFYDPASTALPSAFGYNDGDDDLVELTEGLDAESLLNLLGEGEGPPSV